MGHKGGLNERGLDKLFEDGVGDLKVLLVRIGLDFQIIIGARAALIGRELEPIITGFFANQILVLRASPVGGEVDGLSDVALRIFLLDDERSAHLFGEATNHRLQLNLALQDQA